ncbi:type IV secretory system conjugative DNA transfer family protein [Streptomyces sp. NPDC059534]|uniref:type IV secretory system conjugative DNA transfer family protein n=1 Tax=Streptomyces sp. NPDC059534 TaxID=3346859 RepID=UPI0036818C29
MSYAIPDLPGLGLPGGALGGGGALAVLLVVGVLAQQSKPGDRERFNRAIEQGIGTAVAVIGRYLSGHELVGEPRSEATWWHAGAPLPDDRATETPVDQLGAPPAAPPVKRARAGGMRRVLRIIGAPIRLLFGALAGIWHVLRIWHRWPRFARALVRLAPLSIAWGVWRFPSGTQAVLIAVAGAAFIAALTSPSALGLWRVRPVWTDGQIYGPGLWVALRQILRLEDSETRQRWLSVPNDFKAADARMVLRLPSKWIGGPEAVAAVERVFEERVPGEWVSQWERRGQEHYVQWTPKPRPKEKPQLPAYVPWKPTGDPRRVFVGLAIEGDSVVDAVIQTQTATPHWGVSGMTGSGKSTVLYIPVVHGRMNGELIDILDTKRSSLAAAEGYSGVRIHKTTRECVSAFAEFLTSMMAAEAAVERGADPALRAALVPRTLVIDELPTLIKLAYTWWRYGIKGKGTPPFLDWLGIILLQGRSSNHRVVVGTQQFANAFFGGTMERAQIGTRIAVGQQDRVSWGVAFGQSTPVLGYDAEIPGRGAYADNKKDPDGDYLWVREFQPCYITDVVQSYLRDCLPAPSWFDRGDMAPWITDEIRAEVNATAATAHFLPGGKYGPAVAPGSQAGVLMGSPSSPPATAPHATGGATGGATAAGTATVTLPTVGGDDVVPETYSLSDAHEKGILPWKAATVRTYFKRGEKRGITPPEGITDGQTSYYSEDELTTWLEAWKKWQAENTGSASGKVPGPKDSGSGGGS